MTIIIKPTYACNLRCRYCYLRNETKSSQVMMSVDFAENIISQIKEYITKRKQKKVSFIWHGGEPLLWGKDNYARIFSYMQNELTGIEYSNSVQTNLLLMSEEYIELFLKHDVHVGFSLDGMKSINDIQRVFPNGNGTFDDVMKNYALCVVNGLDVGCIVVATNYTKGRVVELYEFMRENRLSFKFNPLFSSGEAQKNDEDVGVTPDEYAQMAIELFDLWYNDSETRIKESNLEEIASNLISGKTTYCLFGKNCQDNFFAIAPTGDVFPCGRFCDESTSEFSYGNLHNEGLTDILARAKKSDCYNRYKYIEESNCRQCEYFHICHGGCLHDGYLKSGDFKSKTFLCSAYKKIFKHIKGRITETGLDSKIV